MLPFTTNASQKLQPGCFWHSASAALNSVVPHIIVITPMPHADYGNVKVWTVVKKKGISRFVEGKV